MYLRSGRRLNAVGASQMLFQVAEDSYNFPSMLNSYGVDKLGSDGGLWIEDADKKWVKSAVALALTLDNT
jgi:hypothetical protein